MVLRPAAVPLVAGLVILGGITVGILATPSQPDGTATGEVGDGATSPPCWTQWVDRPSTIAVVRLSVNVSDPWQIERSTHGVHVSPSRFVVDRGNRTLGLPSSDQPWNLAVLVEPRKGESRLHVGYCELVDLPWNRNATTLGNWPSHAFLTGSDQDEVRVEHWERSCPKHVDVAGDDRDVSSALAEWVLEPGEEATVRFIEPETDADCPQGTLTYTYWGLWDRAVLD